MNSERLKRIEEIYHAALEVDAAGREDFIGKTCGEDVELRRKIESLLSFDNVFDEFIDTPPISSISQVFPDLVKETSLIDKKIGHYKVRKLIGKGGMGEVYLAEDIKLTRKVALKFLSITFSNKNRLRRFEREALAASALNHPNILTIYEFGEENEIPFLATEFVEGKTIREILRNQEINLKDILSVGEQTAFALSAAHKAGIIHRDIKPENVMLRDDGIIKVLDFGLAKLIIPELTDQRVRLESKVKLESKPPSLAITNSSGVMGTIAYMSPEQVRGSAHIDGRTDIWSLGVVLYEMLTGKPPFGGEKSDEVIAAILKGEFLPIKNYLPDILPDLEKVVGKLLFVDREKRYQNINELLIDLRTLKDEWHFQSKLDISQPLHVTEEPIPKITNQFVVQRTGDSSDSSLSTGNWFTNSSAKYFVGSSKIQKYGSVAALLTVSFLLISGFVYLKFYSSYFQTKPFNTEPISQMRIQTVGDVMETAISPDGKILLYTATDSKKYSLRVVHIADNKTFTVISDSDSSIYEPTFSPDGKSIFYLGRNNPNLSGYCLNKVVVDGGTPEKLIEDVDTMVSFSPDGNEIAFKRDLPQKHQSCIIIAKIDGSAERVLAVRSIDDEGFSNNPVWSKDGKTIVTIAYEKTSDLKPLYLFAINVANGSITRIDSSHWRSATHLQWLAEGKEILVNATDKPGGFTQFWRVSYPDGNVIKVTDDFNKYDGASVNADGTLLATTLIRQNADIFVAPLNNIAEAKKIRSISGTAYYGLDWTPDGKIVFSTNAGGNRDLWMMEADGSKQFQLTDDSFVNHSPVATADGRYIVYVSEKAGRSNVWRMNSDGSNQVRLTDNDLDVNPTVTPDSRWVIYRNQGLRKISIDGGETTLITSRNAGNGAVSPDGKFIVSSYLTERNPTKYNLAILPITGGEPIKFFDRTLEIGKWVGDSIIGADIQGENLNLVSLSLKTDRVSQLTNFTNEKVLYFTISKDGKQIALIRGSVTNEAVVIKNFR